MFDTIVGYLESIDPIFAALCATLFTWSVTALGAALVFFFKNTSKVVLDGMLGFTGGVMVAASVWSLLIPAMDMSRGEGFFKIIPSVVGFMSGALFLYFLDNTLPHFHSNFKQVEGVKSSWQKTTLLILAITLHNIPEGLAVGVLFGGVAANIPQASISEAVILAIGIGIQNFPEGFAVSMPLRRMGVSRGKSFFYGQLSALVEPVAGVLGAFSVVFFTPVLPYALAFAAGAMIYVVVEEVIPESQQNKNKDASTLGFLVGFMVMMSLDVVLS